MQPCPACSSSFSGVSKPSSGAINVPGPRSPEVQDTVRGGGDDQQSCGKRKRDEGVNYTSASSGERSVYRRRS